MNLEKWELVAEVWTWNCDTGWMLGRGREVFWFWDSWDSGERSTFNKFLTRRRVKSMTLLAVE